MSTLTAERFDEFYHDVHGYLPFPWQARVARRVCDPRGNWPQAIALPTAAGKTACIDIAVFALACQAHPGSARTAARRIFFVVDRRIVVDQAYLHATKIREALTEQKTKLLRDVSAALCTLAGDEHPLDVYALRGGIYRDTAWAQSPLQPTVIASTVDQVGSRLLFRGYGVSDSMKPVHAGLVGNDALILLDEAHCAQPFEQTVRYVEKYREWGDAEARPPFRLVSISGTPTDEILQAEQQRQADHPDTPPLIERDQPDDRAHRLLGPRIAASKPTALVIAEKAKGKNWNSPLVEKLAEQARGVMGQSLGNDAEGKLHTVQAVGVIVNRVATARELATKLRESADKNNDAAEKPAVILLTGRMRPVDRDAVLVQLKPLFSGAQEPLEKPVFVVATQCLEVGADLDFHALVTECASLDALRQRFGRLNRIAARPSAKGAVVVRADQSEDSSDDPVYKASLANTWQWLQSRSPADVFDFGVHAVGKAVHGANLKELNAPSVNAPVLFPAYLDCWVQTHPIPTPDPDPAIFLHGPQTGPADVQVVFRGDLGDDVRLWMKIVALRPPSSAEAVAVRLSVFRDWLSRRKSTDESSDLEGETTEQETTAPSFPRTVLCWKGPVRSEPVDDPTRIRPGETYVVSLQETDLDSLCDFRRDAMDRPIINDCGDEAYQRSRDRAILRLPGITLSAESEDFEGELTAAIEGLLTDSSPDWLRRAVADLSTRSRRLAVEHPRGGWVIVGKHRLRQSDPTSLEDDESSESPCRREVTLEEHSRGVADYARRFAAGCGLDAHLYASAGLFHDLGKADPRFQALLKGRSPRTAVGPLLAKSGSFAVIDPAIHQYPQGARHELLSAALLAQETEDDLLLHLVATHHGSGRPFASGVRENDAAQLRPPFTETLFGKTFTVESCAQRPAEWNGELPERFWRMVRRFGWWGVAYREAVFRLADHAQSRAEQENAAADSPERTLVGTLPPRGASRSPKWHTIELSGLDGSNPLAFLAALGTLRLLSRPNPDASCAPSHLPRLSWDTSRSRIVPRLHWNGPLSDAELSEWLVTRLNGAADRAEFSFAPDLTVPHSLFRTFAMEATAAATELDREAADFAAAFGSDTEWKDAELIGDTAFRTMAGAGHQHFLSFMQNILRGTTAAHLQKALFQSWSYDDPVEKMTLRWDPADDVRYALRWRNPSGDPIRKKGGSVLGANCLALMALPLFPTVPQQLRLATTGFRGWRASDTFLTWPVWNAARSVDAIRSLLAFSAWQSDVLSTEGITTLGIIDVFRLKRMTIGKVRNFSPATSVNRH